MPMAKYLLHRGWLVLLKTSAGRGLPIFLKVNHQLESRMQEICQSGSEGGAKLTFVPTPINNENLAFACYHCNLHKGPNLSGIDQESGALVRLFIPREDKWDDHFEQNGVIIVGRTAIGRATIGLLKMNAADRRRLRQG